MSGNAMSLSCAPARAHAFVGESLPLRTELANGTAQAVDAVAPDSDVPPPLTFELRAPGTGKVVHQVAPVSPYEDPDGGDYEPEEPELHTLQPGDTLDYRHDLGKLAGASLTPGDYHLVARYSLDGADVEAPAVELRIEAPMLHHLAGLACPMKWLVCTAHDHLGDDEVIVLAREPYSVEPGDGVFYRWAELAGERQLDSLALAIHTTPNGEGRWMAWTQDGKAEAARPWGNVLSARVPPVDLDLESAILAGPGFQMPGGSGLFVVAGMAPGGAYVAWLRLSGQAGSRGSAVPLAPDLPDRLLARYDPEARGGRIHLVWAETDSAGVKILRRTFLGDGQPEDADPELLLQRNAPLRALELAPLGPGDRAFVHALVGPERGQMSYFRLPLTGPDFKMEEWTFPAPEEQVDDWAIAASTAGDLPVLARCGDRLMVTRAKAHPHWHTLMEGAMGATHLHLLATGDGVLWPGWCEPRVGPVYMALDE